MADSISKESYLGEDLPLAAHKVHRQTVVAVIREQHMRAIAFLVREGDRAGCDHGSVSRQVQRAADLVHRLLIACVAEKETAIPAVLD